MVPGTPMDIPGTGYYVSFTDTERNRFSTASRRERDPRKTKQERRAGSNQ